MLDWVALIISNSGQIYRSPDSKIVDFHNNGSTDNEVVASISASGAGNFLGGVTVGGNGATQYKGSWISDGTLRIGGTLPSAPNIKLQAGGGIVAKNQIVSDRTSGNQQCFSARINNIENGGILASGKVFVIGNGTSAAPDISLNADGSAEFADAVKIGETGTGKTGAIIDNVGAFTSRVAGNTSKAFTVKTSANNDEKIVLYGDGSATFEGNVTAANVTFNLEPENPDNYTTTEEEYEVEVPVVILLFPNGVATTDLVDGEPEQQTRTVTRTREVTTYTGPTMDVKDALVNALATIQQLSARIEALESQTNT